MKIAAIIAEYNPFHRGHLYHIEETRRKTGADGILVLMSGCFVQRGEPAVFDKFSRAHMALSAGADVVLELPSVWSCASAEYFAEGAVRLLCGLNCINWLSFGCETDCPDTIRKLAHILSEEPDVYRKTLKEQTASGVSFAAAKAAALKASLNPSFPLSGLDKLLSSPNATLALEYCKILERTGSSMTPVLIPRCGSGYHDSALLPDRFPSATAIRHSLAQGTPLSSLRSAFPDSIPDSSADSFLRPVFANDASVFLNDRIRQLTPENDILDLSPELLSRILKLRRNFLSWEEWCRALKTRQYTYTRISRCLTHILLGIRRTDTEQLRAEPHRCYARILGLRKDSAVPAALRASAQIPLITKLSDYQRGPLSTAEKKQLETDLRARDLYRLLYWQKYHEMLPDDYARGVITV